MTDSGVNMTSPDTEPGTRLGPGSRPSQNGDVENVRFRRYPYFVTQIPPVSVVIQDEDSESSYYNTMVPFSVLHTAEEEEGVERNGDTQLTGGEMDTESGIGMESQVWDSSVLQLILLWTFCIQHIEPLIKTI